MRPARPTLSAVLLLAAAGCSDWGLSPFRRDECRRDPAACLPDEEPGVCNGEPTTASAIDARSCEPPAAEIRAVKFWEHIHPTDGGTGGSPQLFTASLGASPPEALVSTNTYDVAPDGTRRWLFLRGLDGTEVAGFESRMQNASGRVVVDENLKPWARGRIDGVSVLVGPDGDVRPLAPTPPGSTQIDGALQFGDFDGDGIVEVFGGTSVYDLNGNELVRTLDDHDRQRTLNYTPVADLTGDGRREMMTYRGYLNQRGHYHCRVDDEWAYFYILDVDRDGKPEVLVSYSPDADGNERLALLDGACQVLRETNTLNAIPSGDEVHRNPSPRWIAMVAPLLQPNRPAFVIPIPSRDATTGQQFPGRSAVFDHELNFVRDLPEVPLSGAAVAADLDGDGVYEIVASHWADDQLNSLAGPVVVDVRTGATTVLDDVAETKGGVLYADIDGDGRGEIVVRVRDHDGQWYFRAYKGAGPGFAAAWPFEYLTLAPYLHNPDGTPSQEPVRYDRLAMFNAMPSGGWWVGMNSDLRVRFTDVCEEDCPVGSLTFTVQVGNHGYGDVGNDVLVRIYGERGAEQTLLAEQRYRDVNAGQWNDAEPITVRFEGEPFDRLRAFVAGDGYDVQECDTDNNEAVWNLSCR